MCVNGLIKDWRLYRSAYPDTQTCNHGCFSSFFFSFSHFFKFFFFWCLSFDPVFLPLKVISYSAPPPTCKGVGVCVQLQRCFVCLLRLVWLSACCCFALFGLLHTFSIINQTRETRKRGGEREMRGWVGEVKRRGELCPVAGAAGRVHAPVR